MFDREYYRHRSYGRLVFDTDWWARVMCDPDIAGLYCWLCKRNGFPVVRNYKFGAHISFIKGEEPPHKILWWASFPLIEFWYSPYVRMDNECHAWLDVWSDDLIEIRAALGLPPKLKMSYHLTLGRLT